MSRLNFFHFQNETNMVQVRMNRKSFHAEFRMVRKQKRHIENGSRSLSGKKKGWECYGLRTEEEEEEV